MKTGRSLPLPVRVKRGLRAMWTAEKAHFNRPQVYSLGQMVICSFVILVT